MQHAPVPVLSIRLQQGQVPLKPPSSPTRLSPLDPWLRLGEGTEPQVTGVFCPLRKHSCGTTLWATKAVSTLAHRLRHTGVGEPHAHGSVEESSRFRAVQLERFALLLVLRAHDFTGVQLVTFISSIDVVFSAKIYFP